MSICNSHRRELGPDSVDECPHCEAERAVARIVAWLRDAPFQPLLDDYVKRHPIVGISANGDALRASAEQRRRTPPLFADWLVRLARTARSAPTPLSTRNPEKRR